MDKLVERAIEHTNKLIAKGLLVWHEIPEFDTEQEQKDWWIRLRQLLEIVEPLKVQ